MRYSSEFNEYGVSHLTTIDMKDCKRYCRPHTVFLDSVWIGVPIKYIAHGDRKLQYLKSKLFNVYRYPSKSSQTTNNLMI